MPIGWGKNISLKLKGRSHKEIFGEEIANRRSEQKRKLMMNNKHAKNK